MNSTITYNDLVSSLEVGQKAKSHLDGMAIMRKSEEFTGRITEINHHTDHIFMYVERSNNHGHKYIWSIALTSNNYHAFRIISEDWDE